MGSYPVCSTAEPPMVAQLRRSTTAQQAGRVSPKKTAVKRDLAAQKCTRAGRGTGRNVALCSQEQRVVDELSVEQEHLASRVFGYWCSVDTQFVQTHGVRSESLEAAMELVICWLGRAE